jgi:hypothetical protein
VKALAAVLALALAGCAAGPRMDDARRAFLGTAAEPSAVIAAELAFARMAREKGQWTAFRENATEDAVWPSPGWVNVRQSLKGTPDPAQAIVWEPDSVIVSCDGSFALSTGPATYPSGRRSRFATIWQRQDDGSHRWVLDQGFDLEAGYRKPEMIGASVADCGERRRGVPPRARRGLAWQSGQSDDGTLAWTTELRADCSRSFVVRARRGEAMEEVFRRDAAAPPASAAGPAPSCAA